MSKRLRLRVNTGNIAKTANLLSNTVILASNTYQIGSGIAGHFKARKQEARALNLQMTAEISSAVASLTKVVTETLSRHHAPD